MMRRPISIFAALLAVAGIASAVSHVGPTPPDVTAVDVTAVDITAELDAYWAELSRTVKEGDFEGYGAGYHPDAVLASTFSDNSYPIADALQEWKQLFVDTHEGRMEASVEFRFTQRLHDATTAHETGMFLYSITGADGSKTDQYIHFEALLVKKDGWKMVMEYQKSVASEEEWATAE